MKDKVELKHVASILKDSSSHYEDESVEVHLRKLSFYKNDFPGNWDINSLPFVKSFDCEISNNRIISLSLKEFLYKPQHRFVLEWLLTPVSILAREDSYIPESRFIRRSPVFGYTTAKKKSICYLEFTHISPALSALRSYLSKEVSRKRIFPLIIGFGIFAGIHPFKDGNGRAARSLLSKALNHTGLWSGHDLPLAFLIYRDRERFIKYSHRFLINEEITEFVAYMSNLVAAAAELELLNIYLKWRRTEYDVKN